MGSMRNDWRAIALYDSFILTCVLSAILATVALHEIVGHCMTAWLLGAKVKGVSLGLVGGGLSDVQFPEGASAWRVAATGAGGIAVNLVTGALVLVCAQRARSLEGRLWLACFGATSILGSLYYLANGLYYGWGDPADFAVTAGFVRDQRVLMRGDSRAWIGFVVLFPIAGVVLMRIYLRIQDGVFPTRGFRERFARTMTTLGVVGLVFAAMFLTVGRATSPSAPLFRSNTREVAYRQDRAIEEANRIRRELAEAPPEVVKAAVSEVWRRSAKTPVPKSELPVTLPLDAILAGLVVLAGLVGVAMDRRPAPAPLPLPRPRVLAGLVVTFVVPSVVLFARHGVLTF
jgi:hypothetical protein